MKPLPGFTSFALFLGSITFLGATNVAAAQPACISNCGPPSPAIATAPPASKVTLRYRSVDVMKLTKDVVNNQPSDGQIASVVASAKSMHVTHVAFSTPIDSNSEFQQYGNKPSPRTIEQFTLAWASAIHRAGLHVLFRGTLAEFEHGGTVAGCGTNGHVVVGIYSFPFRVTGDCAHGNGAGGAQAQSVWLNKLQTQLAALARMGVFQSGDILAPLPEPQSNQNFWDTNWNFLGVNGDAGAYGSFFSQAKKVEDAAMSAAGINGVQTGFTSDNGSQYLSTGNGGGHWIPSSYAQSIGVVNVDHYGSDGCRGNTQFSWQEMKCGLDDIFSHYQVPLFQQEWADTKGQGASYVQSMLVNAIQPEVQQGHLVGFNYWDPGCGNSGSLFNCDYTLTATGQAVASWFGNLS